MLKLRPAAEFAGRSAKPYPNDSAEHRTALTALLVEEIELLRHIKRVAKQCRAQPMADAHEITEVVNCFTLGSKAKVNDWSTRQSLLEGSV